MVIIHANAIAMKAIHLSPLQGTILKYPDSAPRTCLIKEPDTILHLGFCQGERPSEKFNLLLNTSFKELTVPGKFDMPVLQKAGQDIKKNIFSIIKGKIRCWWFFWLTVRKYST
ncbi:hypothetical protein A3780_08115 [Kosakonia radicincitans]|nr:hypothetical protein A3780_08115 [Kosakonia radicincitans]